METPPDRNFKFSCHTCAGCNSRIAHDDPRWMREGQHISNEAYFFHDKHCEELMLNREYAEYLHKVKLNSRQEFHRIAGEMREAI